MSETEISIAYGSAQTEVIAEGCLAHFRAIKPRSRYNALVHRFALRATGPFGKASDVKTLVKIIIETFCNNKALKSIYLDDCLWTRTQALIFDDLLYEAAMAIRSHDLDHYTCQLCSKAESPDNVCAIDIEMSFTHQ
jgi:hypothetical protein